MGKQETKTTHTQKEKLQKNEVIEMLSILICSPEHNDLN